MDGAALRAHPPSARTTRPEMDNRSARVITGQLLRLPGGGMEGAEIPFIFCLLANERWGFERIADIFVAGEAAGGKPRKIKVS